MVRRFGWCIFPLGISAHMKCYVCSDTRLSAIDFCDPMSNQSLVRKALRFEKLMTEPGKLSPSSCANIFPSFDMIFPVFMERRRVSKARPTIFMKGRVHNTSQHIASSPRGNFDSCIGHSSPDQINCIISAIKNVTKHLPHCRHFERIRNSYLISSSQCPRLLPIHPS